MPTFKLGRFALLGAGLALLAGCLPPPELAGRSNAGPRAVTAIKVSQKDITVVGPKGYCIDPDSAQERPSGSFVILASCSALVAGSPSAPGTPGVLTALVAGPSNPPVSPTPNQLERFFRSPEGLAALAHDGTAKSVTIQNTVALGDVLYLSLQDKSSNRTATLSERSWRAVLPIKGRLVVLTVTGHEDMPLSDGDARRTLERFVSAMRAANPQDTIASTQNRG